MGRSVSQSAAVEVERLVVLCCLQALQWENWISCGSRRVNGNSLSLQSFKVTRDLFTSAVFDPSDEGEKYVAMIIREGTSVPLIDLPDDAPLPSFYDPKLFKRYEGRSPITCFMS